MEFFSFVLCLRRQLYLEIKEQVHEIDERSKEQVKRKKEMFFVYFFSYFHAFFYFAFVVVIFWGAGGGGRFGKIQSNFF